MSPDISLGLDKSLWPTPLIVAWMVPRPLTPTNGLEKFVLDDEVGRAAK